MNAGLTKHVFTKSDWADVQNFNCGDRAFEQEVANWLKGADTLGTDSALNSINHSDKPCRVWLYKLDGVLVGFGSLAKTEWRWPGKNNDPKLPLTIVIWVGLQKEFQGRASKVAFSDRMNSSVENTRKSAVINSDIALNARHSDFNQSESIDATIC